MFLERFSVLTYLHKSKGSNHLVIAMLCHLLHSCTHASQGHEASFEKGAISLKID